MQDRRNIRNSDSTPANCTQNAINFPTSKILYIFCILCVLILDGEYCQKLGELFPMQLASVGPETVQQLLKIGPWLNWYFGKIKLKREVTASGKVVFCDR